jgi:hypothetical protein
MKKVILLALAATSVVFLVVSPAIAGKRDAGCSASSGTASLDRSSAVTAWGLPTSSTVNLIVTYPDGSTGTGPVPVAADGTYSVTAQASSTSLLAAPQTGTYGYQFVGRVKWPQGTFNQSYASCSMQVG